MARIIRVIGLYGWSLGTALLLCFASPAWTQPVQTAILPEVRTVEIDGFPFPKAIAGLARTKRRDYNVPGLGFSVSYVKPDAVWADIYIYDLQRDLTSEPALSLAQTELEAASNEIHTLVRSGRYQNAEMQSRAASGPFAKTHFRITLGRRELDSFVFVTVHGGKFVKIRLTSNAGEASDRIAEDFARDYRQLLGEPEKKRAL